MEQRTILILTAINMEAHALVKSLGLKRESAVRWKGQYAGAKIVLHLIGIKALQWNRVVNPGVFYDGVILAGIAGGLHPDLNIGDIVVDSSCSGPQSAHLAQSQQSYPRVFWQPICSAHHTIETPEDKSKLHHHSGAWAVEMEAARVQRHFGAFAPPTPTFLHIRGISDAASDPLDPQLNTIVDPYGRPRPFKVLQMLLRNPGSIPTLWKVGKSAKLATNNMTQVVKTYLQSNWPKNPAPHQAA